MAMGGYYQEGGEEELVRDDTATEENPVLNQYTQVRDSKPEKFDFEAPHIYISIRSLLKELLNNDELYSFIAPFILQEEEKFVIRELRKKNVKEVRILLESAKILRIDSQTQQTITDEQADEIKKILRMRNYEEVLIKTRDNKTLSLNRITKTMTSGKSGSKD